jgi:hypothetical protein
VQLIKFYFLFGVLLVTPSLASVCSRAATPNAEALKFGFQPTHVQDIRAEQLLMLSEHKEPDKLKTELHRPTIEFMLRHLFDTLAKGSRTVWDGEQRFKRSTVREVPLNPAVENLVRSLIIDLQKLSLVPEFERQRLVISSVIFASLFSSVRNFYAEHGNALQVGNNLTDGYGKIVLIRDYQIKRWSAMLGIEQILGEPDVDREKLVRFIRATEPLKDTLRKNYARLPSAYPFTVAEMNRIWLLQLAPLGISYGLEFVDGVQYGMNALEYLIHDNGHAYNQTRMTEGDGGGQKVQISFNRELVLHLDGIKDDTQWAAEHTLAYLIGHEKGIPLSLLSAWARGETITISADDFLPGNVEGLLDKDLKYNAARWYPAYFKTPEQRKAAFEVAVPNFRGWLKSLTILPSPSEDLLIPYP